MRKRNLENNPIYNYTRRNKKEYLGINLTKFVTDLYSENNKSLMKEIEDDTNGKIFHAHRLEEQIFSKCPHYPEQSTDARQSLSNTKAFFTELEQININMCMEPQKILNSQSNLEKEQSWKTTLPNFKQYYMLQ